MEDKRWMCPIKHKANLLRVSSTGIVPRVSMHAKLQLQLRVFYIYYHHIPIYAAILNMFIAIIGYLAMLPIILSRVALGTSR